MRANGKLLTMLEGLRRVHHPHLSKALQLVAEGDCKKLFDDVLK
jgi:hypothetical protein